MGTVNRIRAVTKLNAERPKWRKVKGLRDGHNITTRNRIFPPGSVRQRKGSAEIGGHLNGGSVKRLLHTKTTTHTTKKHKTPKERETGDVH